MAIEANFWYRIYLVLTLKDNCYANYLTDALMSSFDPCIS